MFPVIGEAIVALDELYSIYPGKSVVALNVVADLLATT
jgi:hypothetical protein